MPDPRGGRAGDLQLHVILEVPKKIDSEQEALLRELAEHEHASVSAHRSSFFDKLKEWFVPADDLD